MKNLRIVPKRKSTSGYGEGDRMYYNVYNVVRDYKPKELKGHNYTKEVIADGVIIETFKVLGNAKIFLAALFNKYGTPDTEKNGKPIPWHHASDNALKALADGFKTKYPELDMDLVLSEIGKVLDELSPIGYGVNKDEQEWYDYLKDLENVLNQINNPALGKEGIIEVLKKHMADDIDWDNYQEEDEDDNDNPSTPFSLGSVWYCRMEWMMGQSANDSVINLASTMQENLRLYFDELEKLIPKEEFEDSYTG